jgi:hypothetical protein
MICGREPMLDIADAEALLHTSLGAGMNVNFLAPNVKYLRLKDAAVQSFAGMRQARQATRLRTSQVLEVRVALQVWL